MNKIREQRNTRRQRDLPKSRWVLRSHCHEGRTKTALTRRQRELKGRRLQKAPRWEHSCKISPRPPARQQQTFLFPNFLHPLRNEASHFADKVVKQIANKLDPERTEEAAEEPGAQPDSSCRQRCLAVSPGRPRTHGRAALEQTVLFANVASRISSSNKSSIFLPLYVLSVFSFSSNSRETLLYTNT